MDLSTRYMGFSLPHPFMPGASPMVDDLDTVRRLEDAGAAAIVMHSLFEEQITREEIGVLAAIERPSESYGEALSYLPSPDDFALGPDEYLEQVRRIKEAVSVPVIASLNGTTEGGWLDHARLLAQAGADGLELNVYELATDPHETGAEVEERTLSILRRVKRELEIPIAVKLSPYYASLANFAHRVDETGADALVLFNRFYQPDIDPEELEVGKALRLSDPSELLLRLRWLAVLSGTLNANLAVTGGVHDAVGAVKAVMAGAHAVQLVSILLRRGPAYLSVVRAEFERWLEEHEYDSLEALRGCMNLERCPDPKAYERANYLRILQSWTAEF